MRPNSKTETCFSSPGASQPEKRAHADLALRRPSGRVQTGTAERRWGLPKPGSATFDPESARNQTREEENQSSRQTQNVEPIRNASVRYAQALGMHYNVLDPYASLASAAIAEHAAFRSDRERLDKQIDQAANPEVRQVARGLAGGSRRPTTSP